ncbi:MAG: LysM peptidoglycan-binding domain-containing protein [Saprospiraceae bacterium]
MKHISSLTIISILFVTNIFATTSQDSIVIPLRMLHPTDSIEVILQGSSKFLLHRIKPKQTLYSISKYYGLEVSDLMYYNSTLKSGLKINQVIKIPIGSRDIKWQGANKMPKWRMIEVIYTVKPKDTVYKIAKTKFKMNLDTFRQLNNMTHDTLEIGDKVIVGWIDLNGILPKVGVRAWLPISLYSSYRKLKAIYLKDSRNTRKKEIKEKGPAAWHKNQKGNNLYALHKTAPIGTILKVTNPLNNRSLYVKVVGRMQSAGYRYDTLLVLSPGAGKALGGINKSFRVDISYYK